MASSSRRRHARNGRRMQYAPRLSGFTAPESVGADYASKPAEPPTGGRPLRPGRARSVGDPTCLLRGGWAFHALWVARSAMEH